MSMILYFFTFINQMKNYSKTIVKEIKNSENKFKHDNLTRNKCPNCGKFMLEVNGKRGKMNLKYMFYIFYPAHLAVIYLVDMLIN